MRRPRTAVTARMVTNGSCAAARSLPTSSSEKHRCSFFIPSRGMVISVSENPPQAYSQALAVRRIEDRVSNTFSTVFFDRPPVARYATKLCTVFVFISVNGRLPSFWHSAPFCVDLEDGGNPFDLFAGGC